MPRLTKYIALAMLFVSSGMLANTVRAAKTAISADITDGTCQVSVDSSSIAFGKRDPSQFATGTAEIRPLAVNLNCENMAGLSPALKVTGESSGVNDIRLFRDASSTANHVGFMLKKGSTTNLVAFYNAAGTVTPGEVLPITPMDGRSVQQFSVGLVHSTGDPMPATGVVNAKITFAFIFP
ncbi:MULTISPECIES: fimbrial protein [Serratia]|uniref:Fimbrial protein n=1 Tax=Serratia fonticola TaxID=47917 RepID=A0AAE7EK27_SERFO|nr:MULTISPECIES: fimbrial protein [Serratia]QKJ60314.2 fimbrial protein [Serratia fonticola]